MDDEYKLAWANIEGWLNQRQPPSGGIGGVTAALLLQREGYECQVYEQSPVITRLGAGINLYPNGTRILNSLGLESRLFAVGLQHDAKRSR